MNVCVCVWTIGEYNLSINIEKETLEEKLKIVREVKNVGIGNWLSNEIRFRN